jgi:predicted lactoylglutathione lyase
MSLELAMVGLMVQDLSRSLEFYRRLGIDLPPGIENERFVSHRMKSGVTVFWDTKFAATYDPGREQPAGGYRVMLEFFLESEATVDAKYEEMIGYGYGSRFAPVQTPGPYAALIEDPDGNAILLTAGDNDPQ